MIGWFESLQSKPMKRTPEEVAADMAFTAMKAQLTEEQRQREAADAQERAAADATTPRGSSVAAFEARKHLLPECADHFQRHALLTNGKATTV